MKKTCGIFLVNKNNELLIAHPTKHPKDLWSIPKGVPEPFESVLDTALREMTEETSLRYNDLTPHVIYLKRLSDSTYKHNKKRLISFLCVIDISLKRFKFKCDSMVTGPNIKKSFPEMDDFKWVSLDVAEKLLHEAQSRRIPDIMDILDKKTHD